MVVGRHARPWPRPRTSCGHHLTNGVPVRLGSVAPPSTAPEGRGAIAPQTPPSVACARTTRCRRVELSPVVRCGEPPGQLIQDFGPPSQTGSRQAAAYPFTRLRSDLVWQLDHDVPMDRVGPLDEQRVTGRLATTIEDALKNDRQLLFQTARSLVEAEFPPTIAADVLREAGLDPDQIYGQASPQITSHRRRNAAWPGRILIAWDRQLCILRVRRPARIGCRRDRSRAHPMVQLRRTGRAEQRDCALLTSPQTLRPRSPRTDTRPAHSSVPPLHRAD